jgi:hypothetical protein
MPGRLRLRWLASQAPRPLPLPRFFQASCLLRRVGGPCDLRLHSHLPPARSHAASTTDWENSKPAAMIGNLTLSERAPIEIFWYRPSPLCRSFLVLADRLFLLVPSLWPCRLRPLPKLLLVEVACWFPLSAFIIPPGVNRARQRRHALARCGG